MDDESQEITLIEESGAERAFRLHDAFDSGGSTYYLVEAVDDPEMVLLLRESGAGLESVDADEFARVIAELEEE